ncbi:MAG: hypothetical protein WC356_07840 [Candidatus Micrarchaeia archaeon]|jgi:hypothetical protein
MKNTINTNAVYTQPYLRVKKALEKLMFDKNIQILDLKNIFGDFAETIIKELKKDKTKITIYELLNDELALKILYTHIQQITKLSIKDLTVERIEFFLEKNNSFKELKPLDDLFNSYILINQNGSLDIPLTYWMEEDKKLTRMEVYDFPHAIRQAVHVLENQNEELIINEKIINRLDQMIKLIPKLEKNPEKEFLEHFLLEIAEFSIFLKNKKHILKKETYKKLIGTKDKKGALELLSNNNWPAALLCLNAAKNRFIKRNKLLIEMKENIIKREIKLTKSLEQLLQRNYEVLNRIGIVYALLLKNESNYEISRYIIMKIINPYLCDSVGIMIEHKNSRKYLLESARYLRQNDKDSAKVFLLEARESIIQNYFSLMKKD